MQLFNSTLQSLESALNAAATRQDVISNNIANVDTPHYKSKQVMFKNELSKAIAFEAKKTHSRHVSFKRSNENGDYIVNTQTNTTLNNNGNNVDIDREMALLAENQILYNALVDRINGKFNSLKTVARGGK